jgi:hypothetical protein
MTRFFLFIALYSSVCGVFATEAPDVPLATRISSLLEAVSTSQCAFIRNGKSYEPSEGVAHIQKKYAHYEDRIDSIDTFIELTATRSLISGRAYEVQCHGQTMTSAEWMSGKASDLGLRS